MSNPVFQYDERNTREFVIDSSRIMSLNGTLNKALFLALILVAAAIFTWTRFNLGYTDLGNMLTFGGAITGFILAIVISIWKINTLVPIYAACEGLFIGGVSCQMETLFPGIVTQAVACTFAALFIMLFLYRIKLIQCTEKFRSVILVSTASIAGIYLIAWIGSFFGYAMPVINSSSLYGIAFSILVTVIAALNLILDFDYIEMLIARMAPKEYEWFGAFGLMVTIVWLYIEILKLLAKLKRR